MLLNAGNGMEDNSRPSPLFFSDPVDDYLGTAPYRTIRFGFSFVVGYQKRLIRRHEIHTTPTVGADPQKLPRVMYTLRLFGSF